MKRGRFSVLVDAKVGKDTVVYDQVNLYKCRIGRNCKIDAFVYIEEGVEIGDFSKIRAFTFIPQGIRIGRYVYVGPRVTFTNDKYPRAHGEWKQLRTEIGDHASIGAGATILPGLRIGENAMIGAGAVVTKNVPKNAIVVGNPARVIGYEKEKRTD